MPAQKRKIPAINLLPTDDVDLAMSARIIRWLLNTFRILVITVELVVIVGFLSRFFLDSQNSDLTDEINQKKALIESYFPLEKDFKFAQKRLSMFGDYAYGSPQFSEYMSQITSNVPSDIQITRLTLNKGEVTLIVQGSSEQSLGNYATRLSSEPLLAGISIVSVESLPNSSLLQATLKAGESPNKPQ